MDIPIRAPGRAENIAALDGAAHHHFPISEPKPPTLRQTSRDLAGAQGLFESFRRLRYIEQLSSLESFHLSNQNVCAVLRDEWQVTLEQSCDNLCFDTNDAKSVAKVAEALFANLVSELKLDQSATNLYKKFYGNEASVAGMFVALRVLETTGIRHTMTEVVADALLGLVAPENEGMTRKGQHLLRVRNDFLADWEDAKVKALKPYTRAIRKRLVCLLPGEVRKEFRKLSAAEKIQFLLLLPARIRTDFPQIAATANEPGLDDILSGLRRSNLVCLEKIEELQSTEAAFNQTLIAQLAALLPKHVHYQYETLMAALGKCQSRVQDDIALKQSLTSLLRTIHTSASALCQRLTSRDEVFEALQITWAAPPIFCMRFAHGLSDLLSVHQNPARFLNEVRTHLIERLALNAQLAGELQRLCHKVDSQDVSALMHGLRSDMQRVLTRPQQEPDQQMMDQPRHGRTAHTTRGASDKQSPDLFSDVVRWLRTQQLAARVPYSRINAERH